MKKRILISSITGLIVLSWLAGGCTAAPLTPGQAVEVKKGDLDIVVSSDGTLEMPNQFDLKFGTQGQVEEILVWEGRQVKQGGLLATLDNKSQINSIKSALLSVQTAKNNITFGCDTDHLPYNYPNLSIVRIMEEAQRDIEEAAFYYKQGAFKDAGYKLMMTYFDIEVCEDLIRNRPNAAMLAGAKNNSLWAPDVYAGSNVPLTADRLAVIDYLQKYRQRLIAISQQIIDGPYNTLGQAFELARDEIFTVSSKANSMVAIKNRTTYYYPDTPTSSDFLQFALRYIQELEEYIALADSLPVEAAQKLYTAKLNLAVARDVLEYQRLIFETGGSIGWKTLQQYNLSLQSAEIAFYKAKQEMMKTCIIAPSDGTVVSVDLKKSYVLSALDYSSKVAVKLVDTSTVRFKGTLDEIDIMKVKAGQKATITVDAVPGKKFSGTVKFVSPYGTASGKVIKFTVLIDLDPTDVQVRGGLSGTAEILIASARDAFLVPSSVLIRTPAGTVLLIATSDPAKPERRQVKVGIQNLQYAEIVSGLKEGEKVQVPTKSDLESIPTRSTSQSGTMRMLR
jgi:RND family efflux transporter MFP subunit